jgi:hypothetical protein
MGDQPIVKTLPTYRTTQTQNKRKKTSMPRMRFEPTTPLLEQVKTVDDRQRCHCVWSVLQPRAVNFQRGFSS